jgi:predicted metal-dependent enzyme (double-stranded beta helix superfamily)
MDYGLGDFVKELRAAALVSVAEAATVERVKPLVERLARSRAWVRPGYYECDSEQGFGVHVLHEEPDHSLWVIAASWLPHRGAPPHNHGTWAVVAGIDGEEKNIIWRRRGNRLERGGSETIGPGQVATFLSNAIHSVINEGERTTLSLHVYGRNLNFAERSRFDAETGVETPFQLKLQ